MFDTRETSRKAETSLSSKRETYPRQKEEYLVSDPFSPLSAEILRHLIKLLWRKPEGLYIQEIITFLLQSASPANKTKNDLANNEADYEKILRTVTVPLIQIGWLIKTRTGRWYLTAAGRQACHQVKNIEDLHKKALRQLEEERLFFPEAISALASAEEIAWDQIEKYLQRKKTTEIKSMMIYLLRACGYHVSWGSPPENVNDSSDIVAWMDPVGAKKPRIQVQIVHKGQAMTTEGIKSFASVLGNDDHGLIFSTGGLTQDARKMMKSALKNVSVMDLETFFDLWIRQSDRLEEDARRLLPLKIVYFLNP